jgi:hypothetical protein
MLSHPLKKCEISGLAIVDPCPFAPYLAILHNQIGIVLSIDGVCTLVDMVIVDPIQVDLVLWGCYDSCSLNKRWFLSRSIFYGHVFPSNCRDFWMSTPTSG